MSRFNKMKSDALSKTDELQIAKDRAEADRKAGAQEAEKEKWRSYLRAVLKSLDIEEDEVKMGFDGLICTVDKYVFQVKMKPAVHKDRDERSEPAKQVLVIRLAADMTQVVEAEDLTPKNFGLYLLLLEKEIPWIEFSRRLNLLSP
jgi:hypothetical protein